MNILGRILVLIFTLFSLLGLMLAIIIYYEFIDWGRAEPRSVRGEITKGGTSNDVRVPSQYDTSVVIFNDAVAGRNLIVPGVAPAEESLREIEPRFPQNHLFYVAELNKLRSDDGPVDVKTIKADGIPTDTPGKPFGKPIPEEKVDGLNKSLAGYKKELDEEMAKLKGLQDKITDWAKQDAEITLTLTGKDETGKKDRHGLYELVAQEFAMQQQHKKEREYLLPLWATEVEKARRFGARRGDLEATLAGLERALKEQQKKLEK
jgi:uncharacterized coiled-coil protein SlyX